MCCQPVERTSIWDVGPYTRQHFSQPSYALTTHDVNCSTTCISGIADIANMMSSCFDDLGASMNPGGRGDGVCGTGVLILASRDEMDVFVEGTVAL